MPPTNPPKSQRSDPLLGCVLRLAWMGGLPAVLFFSALFLADGRTIAGIPPTLILAATVTLAVEVRWVDVVVAKGQTAEGQPATLRDWRRYAVILTATAAGLWLLAVVAARLGVMR
jgi:hypothetical protein